MKTASVTEAKNGFSGLLRKVRAGHSVLILDRDVPVARLQPVSPSTLRGDERLRKLERQGLLRRPKSAGDLPARLRRLRAPKLPSGRSGVAAVLAERAESDR